MCEYCVKHGEGKKWYLSVKNYSSDLLSDLNRNKFVKEHFFWIDRSYRRYFDLFHKFPFHIPVIGAIVKKVARRLFINKHWSQVLPIEDVEEILNFTNSITRVPCVCRKIFTGKEERLCFLVSLDPNKLGIEKIIDGSYFDGPDVAKFETVDKQWAIDFIRDGHRKGMISTVFAIMPPFAGIICNCEYATGCIPMRLTKDALPFMFRGENIATIDPDLCERGKDCIKICPFGAIESRSKTNKSEVNIKKCYGCGICRGACKHNAISLRDRRSEPTVSNLW